MGGPSTVSTNHGTKVGVPETGVAGVGHKVTAHSFMKDRGRNRKSCGTYKPRRPWRVLVNGKGDRMFVLWTECQDKELDTEQKNVIWRGGLDSGPDTTAKLLVSASSSVSAAKQKTRGLGSVSGSLPFGLRKMSPQLLSRGREASGNNVKRRQKCVLSSSQSPEPLTRPQSPCL